MVHFHYGVKPAVSGEKPQNYFVSISESEPWPWPKCPQFNPVVGQGRIGAEIGTFGMEYNATIKPDKIKKKLWVELV